MLIQSSGVRPFRILQSTDNLLDLNVRFRASTAGPESILVNDFLSQSNVRIPGGLELTYFKEPWLESGAPDVVGVIWDRETTLKWNSDRRGLSKFDLRLIHYLVQRGSTSVADLEYLFSRKLEDALQKLESVEMIQRKGDTIFPQSVSAIYAIKHIFAIEAKISSWQAALGQASRNRWFATTSYVLLPRLPNSDRLRSEAKQLNIGILTGDEATLDFRPLILARSPESYCSWLFNEWTWQAESTLQAYAQSESTVDRERISQFK